jgi:hypothetical protein
MTKTHAWDTSHNSLLSLTSDNTHLTTNQQNNIYLATRQTLLTSQNAQINTIKKKPKKEKKDIVDSPTKDNNHKDKKNNHKDKKKPKKDIVDIVGSPTIDPLTKISEEKVKHKPLCYKCKKLGHYQNNCVSDKKPSKLKTPDLHSVINSLKQEIKEIKTSSFQITGEQLAQEMVMLKINNNHPQNPNIENEVEPEENCKQIVQLTTRPNFKETFLNTIDKILFQKWYTEVRIVIDKEYVFETVALLDTGADSNCIQRICFIYALLPRYGIRAKFLLFCWPLCYILLNLLFLSCQSVLCVLLVSLDIVYLLILSCLFQNCVSSPKQ